MGLNLAKQHMLRHWFWLRLYNYKKLEWLQHLCQIYTDSLYISYYDQTLAPVTIFTILPALVVLGLGEEEGRDDNGLKESRGHGNFG
jgi:hypothetical protein